jgi:Protein of unknown function (DUF3626)
MIPNGPGEAGERAIRFVAARATGPPLDPALRIHVQFHPDRIVNGRTVLDALADDGVYLSQFVTGTSNGGLTAYPGGDRWRWESRMFGGAYDNAPAHTRPIYGALDHRRRPCGAAPRFGSAYLRLRAATLDRATFCHPDSVFEPDAFAVAQRMSLISLVSPVERLTHVSDDPLDDYIEAHVHGPVRLDRDVEAVVLDPSFRRTAVEAAADRLPCPRQWHPGFHINVATLRAHPHYRGARVVALGEQIAVDGRLDPRIIGEAARTGRYDPQELKQVWHYVARFGETSSST